MAVGDAHVFPCFLTPVITQLFFPKPSTTFPTCFSRGERLKYAGKKVPLNRGSNSQPPDHESDTLPTEPPGRGGVALGKFYEKNGLLLGTDFRLVCQLCIGKRKSANGTTPPPPHTHTHTNTLSNLHLNSARESAGRVRDYVCSSSK